MLHQQFEWYRKIQTKLRETMTSCLPRKQMACRSRAKHITCRRMIVRAPCAELNIVVRVRADETGYHRQVDVNCDLATMMAVENGEVSSVNQNWRAPKAIADDLGGKLRHRFGIVLFSRS